MIRAAVLLLAFAQAPQVPPVTGGITRFIPQSPSPNGFIADVPGVVPSGAKASVNEQIRVLQDSGYGDIGIAIVPSIGDYQPYEVGLAIYRTWRIGRVDAIGSARRDLGVLLLIVPKELAPDNNGHCWISTGTGAEGIITDAVSARICTDRIIPHLRTRDYGAALAAGVDAIAERLRGDEGLAGTPGPDGPGVPGEAIPLIDAPRGGVRWWHVLGSLFLLAASIPLVAKWRRNRPRRCPKCGKKMDRLSEQQDDTALEPGQQMEESLKSVDYDVWHCAACEETLVLPYKALFTRYKECPACHRRTAVVSRVVTRQPTYTSRGEARDTTTCKSCGESRVKEVSLPKLTPPSSTSSGGSSGSRSSGSSGSSFGGSGRSSGGGGGSRY
jgi:uncharacterized protein